MIKQALLNYSNPSQPEPPKPSEILGRLSEGGQCLLTGLADNLVIFPANGDSSNVFLASNLCYISKEIATQPFYCPEYTRTIDLKEYGNFFVKFETPDFLVKYNSENLFELNNVMIDEFRSVSQEFSEIPTLVRLWAYLTQKHIKGFFHMTEEVTGLSLSSFQFHAYCIRNILRSAQESKLVLVN